MFTTTNHRHCTRGTSGASSWTRITFWKLSSFRGELLTRKLKPESFSRWVTWVMCKQRRTFGNFREWWSSIRIVPIVRIVRRCLMITIHFMGVATPSGWESRASDCASRALAALDRRFPLSIAAAAVRRRASLRVRHTYSRFKSTTECSSSCKCAVCRMWRSSRWVRHVERVGGTQDSQFVTASSLQPGLRTRGGGPCPWAWARGHSESLAPSAASTATVKLRCGVWWSVDLTL